MANLSCQKNHKNKLWSYITYTHTNVEISIITGNFFYLNINYFYGNVEASMFTRKFSLYKFKSYINL